MRQQQQQKNVVDNENERQFLVRFFRLLFLHEHAQFSNIEVLFDLTHTTIELFLLHGNAMNQILTRIYFVENGLH